MSTHMLGFQSFVRFLNYFLLAKLVNIVVDLKKNIYKQQI